MDYKNKSYGRQAEVSAICGWFDRDQDISMPGPRRLGKSFVLDRLVDAGPDKGWTMVKVEIAGARDAEHCMRLLCDALEAKLKRGIRAKLWMHQRVRQLGYSGKAQTGSTLPQQLLAHDAHLQFEMLMDHMQQGPARWALLIDELPIFLKALHDSGPQGLAQARDFMNNLNRLRSKAPRVRWLITGSIGIEPLARAGQYLGALSKFQPFELKPLSPEQAQDFVQDLACEGRLMHRQHITPDEASALVDAVGWRSAYYIEHVAKVLMGTPASSPEQARAHVDQAVQSLLQQSNSTVFGTWEEHLRKHYADPERVWAFAVLLALAKDKGTGLDLDVVQAMVGDVQLDKDRLRALLQRLQQEGYVHCDDWTADSPSVVFHNPLLRRWWTRWQPSVQA